MQVAFAKNDYQGWLKLMENRAMRLKEVVNSESKFNEFAKAHQAGAEALAQFRANNGLGNRMGTGYGRNR
jgi:hypothetical protein